MSARCSRQNSTVEWNLLLPREGGYVSTSVSNKARWDAVHCFSAARHSAVFTFPIAIISSILAALQMYYKWKSLIDDFGRFNPVSGRNNGRNVVKIKTIELKHKSVLHALEHFDLFVPLNLFYIFSPLKQLAVWMTSFFGGGTELAMGGWEGW